MPIRIRKDSNQQPSPRYNRRKGTSRRSNGKGIASMLIPLLFKLFRKNPKTGILLLVVAGIGYFILNKSGNGNNVANLVQTFAGTGLEMDEKIYDKAEVFEPLSDNIKNPLPESITLQKYCPTRRNQGSQGSCVGWSSGYAARTILEAKATESNPDKVAFSPSFVYNQIALEGCQGTYLQKAMELMKNKGNLPFSKFAYDESSCSKRPTPQEIQEASLYKTKGFNRLTKGGNNYKTDLLAIKQNLAQGAPVVIGMMVGGSFMTSMNGKDLWIPTQQDYNMRGFGGHAMCVIGYDDYKTQSEGAFQIMNSWGESWGNKGLFWIRYSDFNHFVKEAYGLYPMKNSNYSSPVLEITLGLIYNKTQKYIPFKHQQDYLYTTSQPLKINTDFKIEVTNNEECYTYIFGEETDGSSYVLFPYTAKHSPYCGITGTRIFPRDYSLYADNKGHKDHFAIIISKQKLDYNKLNTHINASKAPSYYQKIIDVLDDELIDNVSISDGNTITLKTQPNSKGNMIAVIMEVEK